MSKWIPIEKYPPPADGEGSLVLLYCPKGVERQDYSDRDCPYTIGYFGGHVEHGGKPKWRSIESIMEVHDYGGMTGASTWTEAIEIDPTHFAYFPDNDPPSAKK